MKKCCKILLKIVKWFFIIVIAIVILFLTVRFIGQCINNRTPDYNINGGCDYLCNFELAQEYFDEIHAPRKQLYLMEDTRHLVTGKSEEFSRILHKIAETESKYSNE